MTVEVWIYLGLAFVAVFAVGVFFGCLSGRYDTRHGGTLDLAPAAARGELDLHWDDPRIGSEGYLKLEDGVWRDARTHRPIDIVASYDVPGEGRYEIVNGGPARLVGGV